MLALSSGYAIYYFMSVNIHKVMLSTMDSVLALHPAAPGLILGVPKNFSLDVAEIY